MIVHQNTQLLSRISKILKGFCYDPTPVLKRMALNLKSMQFDFLTMLCNMAHYYFQNVASVVSITLLNMICLSSEKISEKNFSKIVILASPAVKKIANFDPIFKQCELRSQFVADDDLMLIMIQEIKKGALSISIIESFKTEASRLIDYNCNILLISCTKLSLLSKYVDSDVTYVNSIDCFSKRLFLYPLIISISLN